MSRRFLWVGLLAAVPATAAGQDRSTEQAAPAPQRAPTEHVSFSYHQIVWTHEPSAAPATLQGTAKLLRAPGADPTARRGSFQVLVPKGPLQEFFGYVAQRPETDWQFAARMMCVDPAGKRHDLGMQRLGLLSYKETPTGDATTEQFFTIEITEGRLAACLGEDEGPTSLKSGGGSP